MPDKKYTKLLWRMLLIALGLALVWVFLRWGLFWLLPFLIAMFIARLMEYPVILLNKRLKLPRWAASAICTLLVYGVLSVLIYLLVSRIIIEVGGLLNQLPEWMAGLPDVADRFTRRIRAIIVAAPVGMQEFLNNSLDSVIKEGITIPQSLYQTLGSWVTGVAGALPNLFLFVITSVLSTYFISSDYPRVSAFIMRQLPERWQERVARTKTHLMGTLGKWLKAQGLLLLMTFVQLCVGFLLIGVEFPLLIAAVVCLVDALPILGLGIVLVPWALISLLAGNTARAIGLILVFAVCSLVRSFAEPKLVGEQIGLPPIVTMLAMYVGFQTFGVLGMVLFPIVAITLKQLQEWGYVKLWRA